MQKLALVADDDISVLNLLSGILETRGFRVIKAETGSEAVMAAMNSAPDIIITDINMPSGYGSSLYHRLQQEEETKKIPFIFITGLPPEQARTLVPVAPGVVLLTKPVAMQKLLQTIASLLPPSPPQ